MKYLNKYWGLFRDDIPFTSIESSGLITHGIEHTAEATLTSTPSDDALRLCTGDRHWYVSKWWDGPNALTVNGNSTFIVDPERTMANWSLLEFVARSFGLTVEHFATTHHVTNSPITEVRLIGRDFDCDVVVTNEQFAKVQPGDVLSVCCLRFRKNDGSRLQTNTTNFGNLTRLLTGLVPYSVSEHDVAGIINTLEQKILELETEISELRKTLDVQFEDQQVLIAAIADKEREVSDLREQLEDLTEYCAMLHETVRVNTTELDKLNLSLKEAHHEITVLRQQLAHQRINAMRRAHPLSSLVCSGLSFIAGWTTHVRHDQRSRNIKIGNGNLVIYNKYGR